MRSVCFMFLLLFAIPALAADPLSGDLHWKSTGPLIRPAERPDDPCDAIKDPTIVRHDGKWHVFATIRSHKRTHQIEYLNFTDWNDANAAPRHVLKTCPGYFCAPQVFYFTPQKQWCLVYQVPHPGGKKTILPAVSTATKLDDPDSWSEPKLLFDEKPDHVSSWIDFWVTCDADRAHLFFTSNDGRMWRCDTAIHEFPRGWNEPKVVLTGDIFEASHTYKLKDRNEYLTVIEAQGERGRRYYKSYIADHLAGEWRPLAATRDKPFASFKNIGGDSGWTTSISHGELLRTGVDEHLEVDPAHLQFLYQGVSDEDREGRPYGKILWKLGLLTLD
ncbi:MAG TPA: non-reducing end alpha-L-arabinofuranosidase family hydrolase [Caulifigura sp.]|nr:non-reducing end alpha-L-arabinofuranosidase family hydrolase [Caulifigura sp.]